MNVIPLKEQLRKHDNTEANGSQDEPKQVRQVVEGRGVCAGGRACDDDSREARGDA